MLSHRRLADAELVCGCRHRARPDVHPQALELAPHGTLADGNSHQALMATANRGTDVLRVTFSSTFRGRNRRWAKLARPLSPRPRETASAIVFVLGRLAQLVRALA